MSMYVWCSSPLNATVVLGSASVGQASSPVALRMQGHILATVSQFEAPFWRCQLTPLGGENSIDHREVQPRRMSWAIPRKTLQK